MDSLETLISVCKAYINSNFGIEDFQRRLETIMLPDEYKNTLEKDQHNAVNKLESIKFSYLPENQKKYANVVAEELIHATRIFIKNAQGSFMLPMQAIDT